MNNCIACQNPLRIMNTPVFGFRTQDGGTICTECTRELGYKSGNEIMILIKEMKKLSTLEFKKELNRLQNPEKGQKQSLKQVQESIQNLNPRLGKKREVNELPEILMADEKIEKVESGILKNGTGITGNGLLVATNIRLIFIDKPTFGFGIKMEDFPYEKISSVSVSTGFLKGELKLICSGNAASINLVTGAKIFSEFIRQKTSYKQKDNSENNESLGILEKIEKLAELRDKGIISNDEFDSKKVELLSKL